jgi:hypothetical protein
MSSPTPVPPSKVFVLWFGSDNDNNLSALNNLLNEGWQVDKMTPMSGASTNYSRAVVYLVEGAAA